jgi:hypothetical protein
MLPRLFWAVSYIFKKNIFFRHFRQDASPVLTGNQWGFSREHLPLDYIDEDFMLGIKIWMTELRVVMGKRK